MLRLLPPAPPPLLLPQICRGGLWGISFIVERETARTANCKGNNYYVSPNHDLRGNHSGRGARAPPVPPSVEARSNWRKMHLPCECIGLSYGECKYDKNLDITIIFPFSKGCISTR